MRLDDLLRVSIRQVYRHRHRYLGVVLAIALGVAGLITVITMGQQVKKAINQDLRLIGGATLIKTYFDHYLISSQPQWFQEPTLADLRHLSGVGEVSPIAVSWVQVEWHQERHRVWGWAVDENFWKVRSLWATTGRLFLQPEVAARRKVCVLGENLAQKIFGPRSPDGEMLKIENDLYKIIGVVGGISSLDLSHTAFLPLTTFADRIPEAKPPYQVNLRCVSWDDVEKVAAAIPRVVGRHQPIEQLRVEFPREALNNVKRVAWWIESFVYLAIASTLVLGGFGVWAVMMAAVRSRTREIGLKKAMGAEECDVLTQFITEALCLSLGAAILGIILGRLMVEGVSLWLGTRPSEGLFLRCLGLGLLFALLLGAGGGIYPSLRASRMEVVEATRYE